MKYVNPGLLLFLLILSLYGTAQTVISESSAVQFEISNFGFNTVEGTFSGITGQVDLKADRLSASSIQVCLDAANLNTGIEKRDAHLRGEDFFYVKKYPEICFTSTTLQKTGDGYTAKGNLTLHGVTREEVIRFRVEDKVLTASFTVNRFDYGLGAEAYSGTFSVGETAELEVRIAWQ